MNILGRMRYRLAQTRGPKPGAGPSPRRICFFVVGTGRCGSTLLRDLLNLHPELFVPAAESHWIPLQHELLGARRHPLAAYTAAVERVYYVTGELTVDVMAAGVGTSRSQLFASAAASLRDSASTLAEFNDALFGALAAAAGRATVGDKTPCYCLHMPLLQGIWPDAKFIHLIRDGRDVALSMSKHPGFRLMQLLETPNWPPLAVDRRYMAASGLGRNPSLEDYIGLWSFRLHRALEDARRLRPGSYFEMRYEDLLGAPRFEMGRLAEFLGIARPGEWLAAVERTVRAGNVNKIADRARWEALTALCRDTLAELGYAT